MFCSVINSTLACESMGNCALSRAVKISITHGISNALFRRSQGIMLL